MNWFQDYCFTHTREIKEKDLRVQKKQTLLLTAVCFGTVIIGVLVAVITSIVGAR